MTKCCTRGQPAGEMPGNALARLAVPKLGHAASLAARGDDVLGEPHDARVVPPDDDVCALLDGDRPFRVLAHGETGHAESRGFLLYATGVGDDEPRRSH